MKTVLKVIGSIAIVLAILGIFLPLLPTTPFLLLASACFARSSERAHRWLLNNPLFGAYLRDIEQNHGIPLKGKIVILIALWLSLAFSISLFDSRWVISLLALTGIAVTVWILQMKTLSKQAPTESPPQ